MLTVQPLFANQTASLPAPQPISMHVGRNLRDRVIDTTKHKSKDGPKNKSNRLANGGCGWKRDFGACGSSKQTDKQVTSTLCMNPPQWQGFR